MALKDHKGLKIVYWNTQSQFHKQQEAVQLIQQNDLDILITLETCFKEDITDNFIAIKNYNLVRQDRTTKTDNNMVRKGCGFCIYIKNTIPFETEWEGKVNCNDPNLEMLTVKLTIHNLWPIFVPAVYRPPSGSLLSFKQHMYNLLNVITLS